MTTINRNSNTTASVPPSIYRHPQRICVNVSWALHQQLVERSDLEGRSLSNLAAFLLERSVAVGS